MPTKTIPVYVASPFGFDAAGREFIRQFYQKLGNIGFNVLDPWAYQKSMSEAAIMQSTKKHLTIKGALQIGNNNIALINSAKLMVAILDGPTVDEGVACEIGRASALGKLIFGLRTDIRPGEIKGMNLQIYAEIKHAGGDLFDTSHKLFSALIDYKEKFDAPKYYRGKPPV